MYNSDFTIKKIISTYLLQYFCHSSVKAPINTFLRDRGNYLS